ncbi:uncharacterized protein TrAtP1_002780 [Trichoderma atroviride]|uniref:uncharacterized protein n=1 Tax=Hypocrea atroviridis TaxID=63577 RepID=UPI00332DAFD0|nr:hypothetical protein TrAtP1_002780 [Trichoderma atroviride]
MEAEAGGGRAWREALSEAVDGEIVTTPDQVLMRPHSGGGSWLVSVLLWLLAVHSSACSDSGQLS